MRLANEEEMDAQTADDYYTRMFQVLGAKILATPNRVGAGAGLCILTLTHAFGMATISFSLAEMGWAPASSKTGCWEGAYLFISEKTYKIQD